jgi:DNA-binding MarR family transcriptional regulator
MNNSKIKTNSISPEQLAERLEKIFSKFTSLMFSADRNYLARGIINLPQVLVLRQIADNGPCSMQTLARALGIKSSTLTGIMDRLLALGLVKRHTPENDRRKVMAETTSKGRRILDHISEERKRSISSMFRMISPEERGIYLGIIEKIAAGISAPGGKNREKTADK